ncbi:hypothetical protein ASF61_06850 [Duganella sp. Leaf126]|uniref:DUF4128 domain-containing protein n=1 Tax=Duganella sp. Leaf126 TaxID=1736266 RepID=UPI0006FA6AA8|nr:DUF4128 domain-containing protein [Duganella sp. Leaf126]KQQ40465.1 hypothetical protein ASF61_06850 [Duganella sp. Leaf126]
MSNKIIRSALEGRLKGWAAAQVPPIPVFLENRGKTPTVGERHLRADLLPGDTHDPSQGAQHRRYHGMYQVGVFLPENDGTGDADDLAKAIEVLFRCPTVLTKQGLNVRIMQTPSIAQSRPDGNGFWMTPITIKYSADDFS